MTPQRGCSSVGRALEWHSRGQEFNSLHLHQNLKGPAVYRRPFLRCASRLLSHVFSRAGASRSRGMSAPYCPAAKAGRALRRRAHRFFRSVKTASPTSERNGAEPSGMGGPAPFSEVLRTARRTGVAVRLRRLRRAVRSPAISEACFHAPSSTGRRPRRSGH